MGSRRATAGRSYRNVGWVASAIGTSGSLTLGPARRNGDGAADLPDRPPRLTPVDVPGVGWHHPPDAPAGPGRPGVSAEPDPTAVRTGTVIDVAGLALAVHADDDARAEAIASLFRHATIVDTPPDCTLRVVATPIELPATDPDVETAELAQWRTTADDTLWLRAAGDLRARGTPTELVVGGPGDFPTRTYRFVVLVGLARLLADHGRHLLHGAAFLIDGRAVVVLGNTGMGKSTLAYAAHRAGLGVIADDAVIVHLDDGTVRIAGRARPISVAADVAPALAGARPVPDDLRARVELPADTLVGGTHPAAALVVLEGPDPGGAALAPIAGVEVLHAVIRVDPTLADAQHRPRLFAIAGALGRLPTWRAHRGTDPARALDDARALVTLIVAGVRSTSTPGDAGGPPGPTPPAPPPAPRP